MFIKQLIDLALNEDIGGLDLRFGHNVGAMLVITLLEGEHKVRPYNSVRARIMSGRNEDQGHIGHVSIIYASEEQK